MRVRHLSTQPGDTFHHATHGVFIADTEGYWDLPPEVAVPQANFGGWHTAANPPPVPEPDPADVLADALSRISDLEADTPVKSRRKGPVRSE